MDVLYLAIKKVAIEVYYGQEFFMKCCVFS